MEIKTMDLIARPQYTERIRPFIGKNIIKVLTGQRRIGKSSILKQLAAGIKQENPKANIIFVNKELDRFRDIRTDRDLSDYLKPFLKKKGSHYLFVDEIQEIENFQLCLRSLLAEGKCDIFCTGSNAHILSGELATFLAGRAVSFDVHSLGYAEFLRFHGLERGGESLQKYLTFGGMPHLAHIGLNNDVPFEYLRNVYSAILLKDTVAREKIRNVVFLEDLVAYLADNVGSIFSATNISKFLKSQRIAMSPQVTINYLRALANAFLVHKVSRAEIGGMRIFESGDKYYFEDIGISHAVRGFNLRRDIGKVMENAVFLHLLQNGHTVHVGQLGTREIDFVAEKAGEKIYVQVSASVADEATAKREFGNLMAVEDNFPKYVVTLNDIIAGRSESGIRHVNLEEFLLTTL